MATRQTSNRGTPRGWRARVKLDQIEYYLGTFPTSDEAIAAEEEFRRTHRGRKYPRKVRT